MKKIIAVLLTVALLIGSLPMAAFADAEPEQDPLALIKEAAVATLELATGGKAYRSDELQAGLDLVVSLVEQQTTAASVAEMMDTYRDIIGWMHSLDELIRAVDEALASLPPDSLLKMDLFSLKSELKSSYTEGTTQEKIDEYWEEIERISHSESRLGNTYEGVYMVYENVYTDGVKYYNQTYCELVGDKFIVVNCYVPAENMDQYAIASAFAMSYGIFGY